MSRLIIGSKRQPDEPRHEFNIRCSKRVRALWRASKILPWDRRVLHCIHHWAGHIARYATYDAEWWPCMIPSWRDSAMINRVRMMSSDGRHLYRGLRRRPWRSEDQSVRFYGSHPRNRIFSPIWRQVALDSSTWGSFRPRWVKWRFLGMYCFRL